MLEQWKVVYIQSWSSNKQEITQNRLEKKKFNCGQKKGGEMESVKEKGEKVSEVGGEERLITEKKEKGGKRQLHVWFLPVSPRFGR